METAVKKRKKRRTRRTEFTGNKQDLPVKQNATITPPVRFDPNYHVPVIEKYCREHGRVTFTDLAEVVGVDTKTISKWYYGKDSVFQAYQRGVDAYMGFLAERVLEELVSGRRIVEQTKRTRHVTRFDKDNNPRTVKEVETIERERIRDPDYKAVMTWLQTRLPGRWPSGEGVAGGQHLHLHKHEHEVRENLKELSDDELRDARQLVERLTGKREGVGE